MKSSAVFHDVLTAPAFRQDNTRPLEKSQIRQRHRPPQRRSPWASPHREFADIHLRPPTIPTAGLMEYAHRRQHQARRCRGLLQALLLPGQHHPRRAGRFLRAEMKAKIEKLFGSLERHPAARSAVSRRSITRPKPGIYVATKTDVTQSHFAIGQLGGDAQR